MILVTGGHGFIGKHLVDILSAGNEQVVVIDSLEDEVHDRTQYKGDFKENVGYIWSNLTKWAEIYGSSLSPEDTVVHLASKVSVASSLDYYDDYIDRNVKDTIALLNACLNAGVKKFVLASSVTVYGEPKKFCRNCLRQVDSMDRRLSLNLDPNNWDMRCSQCGSELHNIPIMAHDPMYPISLYGMTKLMQEQLTTSMLNSNIPWTILRFFNVYGPGQSPTNPYAGVIQNFVRKVRNGEQPLVYEDGNQLRDFVHVADVIKMLDIAIHNTRTNNMVYNVGSGVSLRIGELAQMVCDVFDPTIEPKITNALRAGDVRSCYADIRRTLEFMPLPQSPVIGILRYLEDLKKEYDNGNVQQ
jgi:dTDP-L-rhamnose 4-epimerase